MTFPIFDPRNTQYKNPFGAIEAGGCCRLRILPPRGFGVKRAFLELELEQLGEKRSLPMAFDRREGDRDAFVLEFQLPETPGLIWYYFRLEGAAGTLYFGKNGLGSKPQAYQLTVYINPSGTPAWFSEGVLYQIFPDRFARVSLPDLAVLGKKGWLHENWADQPEWRPNDQGIITNSDFFGGSLKGIEARLPYLQELGVTILYLNPIFRAASNHRYDTGDYGQIDPLLGSRQDFEELCAAAKALGIRVMLDGVFSHTGDDSLYFNKYGRYDSLGAYQSKDSPYADWYGFSEFPDRYASWWGIDTLPEVNELSPAYLDYIARDQDSVVRRWLRRGASAWRLDVADELPDDFIAAVKAAERAEKSDSFLLGEVWEDATNKVSYGARRRYVWEGLLDSVMNYPFRNALLAYLLGGRAEDFMEAMEILRENYPPHTFYACMNFLGTHDTPRILTVLGTSCWPDSREGRAAYRLSPEEYALGKKRLLVAAALLFTFPGTPTVFYGDEAGMQGFEDPFNRGTFPWGEEDGEILARYKALANLRKNSAALQKGSIRYLRAEGPLLVYTRELEGRRVTALFNAGPEEIRLTLFGKNFSLPPVSAQILED